MSENEKSTQQTERNWLDRIYQGSLLDQNSTLELILKVSALLVALSWIDGRVESWMKSDAEQAKLTNIGCVVPAHLMTKLDIPKPVEGSTSVESYLLRRDEFAARLLSDRDTIREICRK